VSKVLLLLVTIVLVVLLVGISIEDPGYVLISRAPHQVEISLSFFLIALLVVIILAYFIVRLVIRVLYAPRDIGRWRGRRNILLARRATLDGYARLIEGDWKAAEKILTRRLSYSTTPLLDCLGAAYAAQQGGDSEARDEYLARARILDPDHIEAIELTRARLLERSGRTDEARDVLEGLHERGVDSGAAQGMLISLLRLQQDWRTLEEILPQLKRSSLLPAAELETAWRDVQCQRLSEDSDGDGGNARRVWFNLSRRDRKDPLIIRAYCRRLMDTGKMADAEKLLGKTIGRQWDGDLVRLYGLIRTDHPGEQIRVAEGWAKTRPKDSDLLTALARLCLHSGNRDRARSLLIEAARQGAGRESYMELGLLLEAAGEGDKALQAYRRGLERLSQATEPMPVASPSEFLPLTSESTGSN
jgi:HemY protein